jgi:2'-5' RNA ligase
VAKDHFEEHAAVKGRTGWAFSVLFTDQPQVAEMAQRYAEVLQHPGLYPPLPPQWLHATILAVGPTDAYTEQEMSAVADALAPKLSALPLPEFVFDSWWLWDGNVVLHITPGDKFSKIYDFVIEAMESVVGIARTPRSPNGKFLPHTAMAYTRTHASEREIHRLLVDHPIEPATFNATHLSLLKQWPDDGYWAWEVIREIGIGALR